MNHITSRASRIKVRAVTRFIVLTSDDTTWAAKLKECNDLCTNLVASFDSLGYETQTVRIVTNPFGEFLDCSTTKTVLAGLEKLKCALSEATTTKIRIRLAIGAARTLQELSMVPEMIQGYGDLCNICVNIKTDEYGVVDSKWCHEAACTMKKLSACTERGEGNFNFTANFSCPPLIPYFPAGYNTSENGECFAIGLEHPDLLHHVLEPLGLRQTSPEMRSSAWANAAKMLRGAIQTHVSVLVKACAKISSESGVQFAGLDSSAAPSKDVVSMCTIIEDLGVEYFGAAGTIEACAFLTRVFKSVEDVPLIGFSGLMLTCLEDTGMATAAAAGHYDIRSLLQYSCVCGIGLDCVPIPGDSNVDTISALMRDTGTLAFRYNKPLTVRLFPCPGLSAGEMTKFESDDLCNCTVFSV